MTGVWEQRLINIAYGQDYDMPSGQDLIDAMDGLEPVLKKAAEDPGISGNTGMTASDKLDAAAKRARAVKHTTTQLRTAMDQANTVRTTASDDYVGLSGGELSSTDEAIVRGAAAGATIMFPGFSIVAGQGAVSLVNWFLGNQREDAAKAAVQKASDALDKIEVPTSVPHVDDAGNKGSSPGSPSGPSVPSSPAPSPSFPNYPGADEPPATTQPLPPGLTLDNRHPQSPDVPSNVHYDPTIGDGRQTPIVVNPGDPMPTPWPGGDGSISPDGPVDGGTIWGGPGGSGSGVGSGGLTGGTGYGSGSGLLGGIGAGAATVGVGGAALGGARLVQGAMGGAAMPAGTSAGAAGAGGMGAGGTRMGGAMGAGGMGAGGRGAAGTGRTGGMLGGGRGTGGSSAKSGASSSAKSGAGSRAGMAGSGGRGAAGRDRDRQEGRGLGGPIAPHLEDEAERGPRSEAAGAGERE